MFVIMYRWGALCKAVVTINGNQLVLDPIHQQKARQLSSFLKGVPTEMVNQRGLFDCNCLEETRLLDAGCSLSYLPPSRCMGSRQYCNILSGDVQVKGRVVVLASVTFLYGFA